MLRKDNVWTYGEISNTAKIPKIYEELSFLIWFLKC